MSQAYETFGKYILFEKLAMGGMAEIYLARSPGASGVSKMVAIKRILPQFSEQTEFIDMFKDEAKIAVNLSHANVVSIFEFGIEREQFYLAMEYVEGRNLRQILNKMKKSGSMFSTEQVIYIIKEVAAGLDHAHRCVASDTGKPLNIIHRDMSPQNIMVSFEGEIKVVDFGIAKAETQLENTRAGTLKGKFGYMSPEQAEGMSVDLRTDVFALGIVLWELLANDRLFVSNDEVNTLRKIRDCQIPSLRKINPNIPPELERIVGKALAKDRNLRYQTAGAFHRELGRFLNRQYPDFSPQDFSIFIKTLFSPEILDSRKKIVEYSRADVRMPAGPVAPQNTQPDPRTGITQTESTEPPAEKPQLKVAQAAKAERKLPAPTTQPSTKPERESNAVLTVDRSVLRAGTRENSVSLKLGSSGLAGTRSYSRHQEQTRDSSGFLPILFVALAVLAGGGYFYSSNPEQATMLMAKLHLMQPPTIATSISSTMPVDAGPARHDISVSSSPSGAEIFVNGVSSHDVTPTTLKISDGQVVTIAIQLRGYLPYEETVTATSNLSVNVALVKQKIGYLDIVVAGAGAIHVDGKLVAPSSPALHVPVIAGRDLTVDAYDPTTRTFDERRVIVAEGRVVRVNLIPRMSARGTSRPETRYGPGGQ